MTPDARALAQDVKEKAERRHKIHGQSPWQKDSEQMMADLAKAIGLLAEQVEKERATHVPEVH